MSIELIAAAVGMGLSLSAASYTFIKTILKQRAERLLAKELGTFLIRLKMNSDYLKMNEEEALRLQGIIEILEQFASGKAQLVQEGLLQPSPEGRRRYRSKLIKKALKEAESLPIVKERGKECQREG